MKWTAVVLFFALCACKKKEDLPPNNSNGINPFGVIIGKSEGVTPGISRKMQIAKSLGAVYVRDAITLSSFSGSDAGQDSLRAYGFKPVSNFNWYPVSTTPTPFVTAAEMPAYAAAFNNALAKYPPQLAVMENEETNLVYHSGSMQEYINMLNAAIPVAHARGIKITNGGVIGGPLNILVWRDYITSGQPDKADDFAKRSFPPAMYKALPAMSAANEARAARTDSLLTAYATLPLDYVNFHWYADLRQAGSTTYNTAIDTMHIDTKALKELVDYLKRRTGKPVITNEIGEWYYSAGYVTDIMQAVTDMKLPYCIWYSGDGDDRFDAKALQDRTGNLRPSGIAYKAFIESRW